MRKGEDRQRTREGGGMMSIGGGGMDLGGGGIGLGVEGGLGTGMEVGVGVDGGGEGIGTLAILKNSSILRRGRLHCRR